MAGYKMSLTIKPHNRDSVSRFSAHRFRLRTVNLISTEIYQQIFNNESAPEMYKFNDRYNFSDESGVEILRVVFSFVSLIIIRIR